MIVACRTESVKEGVILYAACIRFRSMTFNPYNSKMSVIKILFLLCGVFVIILAQHATL